MSVYIDVNGLDCGSADTAMFKKLLERHYFRVSDCKMSYRQIQLLEDAGLLSGGKNGKWQTFNTKDLIYLQVIKVLKVFRLSNEQLAEIEMAFFGDGDFAETETGEKITNPMDFVLWSIFLGNPWILLITRSGDVYLFEERFSELFQTKDCGFVCVNLYKVVLEVASQLNEYDSAELAPDFLFTSLLRDKKFADLGKEFLSILRNEEYQKITIKRDGDNVIVHAKSTKGSKNKSIGEVIRSIEERDFQTIEVRKRKNKVVSYSQTDIYKAKYLKALQNEDEK